MGSRWNHWVIEVASLFLIFIAGLIGTAIILDVLYNHWLLDRETRLIFTSLMMSF